MELYKDHPDFLQQGRADGVGGRVSLVTETGTQTLTNKTLTTPTISSPTISGTIGGTPTIPVRQPQTVYAEDGAIAIATHTAVLTKAGVNAMTLAAPAADDNGVRVTVISATNNAHTVTVPTDKGHDGTTGVNELFTFAAFAGASMVLEAYEQAWYVVSLNAVTPSSTT